MRHDRSSACMVESRHHTREEHVTWPTREEHMGPAAVVATHERTKRSPWPKAASHATPTPRKKKACRRVEGAYLSVRL